MIVHAQLKPSIEPGHRVAQVFVGSDRRLAGEISCHPDEVAAVIAAINRLRS